LLLLAGLVDDEGGALGFLLGDLLGFHGGGEFGGEGEVLGLLICSAWVYVSRAYCKGDIIKHNVESRRPPYKIVPHQPRHVLTLCDQLTGVELRHHALEHLVDNRRQHPLVVVGSQRPIDLRQSIDSRSRQYTAGYVDHLQVLGSGEGSDVSWFGADIVGDGGFEPWDTEVSSFAVDFLLDAADSGVLDCAVTTVDCAIVSIA
jgi:hypothetical protein